MSDATLLLTAVEQGDPMAAEQLLTLVYSELRKLAASKMAREAPGQTLQATALVHEAWLRLLGSQTPSFANRAHFFSAAAEAMRRILIDRARHKLAARHGGGDKRIDLDELNLASPDIDEQLLRVNDASNRASCEGKSGPGRSSQAALFRGHDERRNRRGSRHLRFLGEELLDLRTSLDVQQNQATLTILSVSFKPAPVRAITLS